MHTFSIYLLNGRLVLSIWHGKRLREYVITEKRAIAVQSRLRALGFLFGPRFAQFGWTAGRLENWYV